MIWIFIKVVIVMSWRHHVFIRNTSHLYHQQEWVYWCFNWCLILFLCNKEICHCDIQKTSCLYNKFITFIVLMTIYLVYLKKMDSYSNVYFMKVVIAISLRHHINLFLLMMVDGNWIDEFYMEFFIWIYRISIFLSLRNRFHCDSWEIKYRQSMSIWHPFDTLGN